MDDACNMDVNENGLEFWIIVDMEEFSILMASVNGCLITERLGYDNGVEGFWFHCMTMKPYNVHDFEKILYRFFLNCSNKIEI